CPTGEQVSGGRLGRSRTPAGGPRRPRGHAGGSPLPSRLDWESRARTHARQAVDHPPLASRMAGLSTPGWRADARPLDRACAAAAARGTRGDQSRQQLRKDVPPIDPEWQRLGPQHRRKRPLSPQMREKTAAARHLPLERGAERTGIDRDQQQILQAGEMLGCGGTHLRSGGEMNEAITGIDASTTEDPLMLRLPPKRLVTDLVNRASHSSRLPPAYRVFR